MRSRKLSLKRETLTPLSHDEMASVAGGTHVDCTLTHGPSLDQPCPTPTLPVFVCITNPRECAQIESFPC